jgi:hypothetical protein
MYVSRYVSAATQIRHSNINALQPKNIRRSSPSPKTKKKSFTDPDRHHTGSIVPGAAEQEPALPRLHEYRTDTTYRVKGIPLRYSWEETRNLLIHALKCTAQSSPILKSLAIAIQGNHQHATVCFDILPDSLQSHTLPATFQAKDDVIIRVDTDFIGMTTLKSCKEHQHTVKYAIL